MINMIGSFYAKCVKPLLFKIDPEVVHDRMLSLGNLLGRFGFTRRIIRSIFLFEDPSLQQTIHGISFLNPVGLSAGFDKDGVLLPILSEVGFGFSQVGSVTFQPYAGNPKPRLYRLPQSKGIVVYYGLKNEGVARISKRIQSYSRVSIPVSISVAKTNCADTATDEAGILDYCSSLEVLKKEDVGDFYTINVSCPNTFGGEPFTTPQKLEALLAHIDALQLTKPVFLKLPIDLPWDLFKPLVQVATSHQVAGVVIGNLTKDRSSNLIKEEIPASIKGGISGMPTQALCNELISQTYQAYGDRLTIIGVGGIFSAADAYEKIQRGASLVQLITGLIYEGPQLVHQLNRDLVTLLKKDGYNSISDAVGSYYR